MEWTFLCYISVVFSESADDTFTITVLVIVLLSIMDSIITVLICYCVTYFFNSQHFFKYANLKCNITLSLHKHNTAFKRNIQLTTHAVMLSSPVPALYVPFRQSTLGLDPPVQLKQHHNKCEITGHTISVLWVWTGQNTNKAQQHFGTGPPVQVTPLVTNDRSHHSNTLGLDSPKCIFIFYKTQQHFRTLTSK